MTIDRREFIRRAAVAGASVLLTSMSRGIQPVRDPRPILGAAPETLDTRWPIKRVVYLMLENRSFDNLFGTFPGARGTTVGNNLGAEIPLIHCPEWLPGDIPHDRWAHLNMWNGGRQDAFAQGKFGDPFGYSQFEEADVPNYFHWAREYVLCDNFFASVAGPSFPNHLFYIAGSAGGAIDNPENIEVLKKDGREYKSWGIDAYGDNVFVLVEDDRGQLSKHETSFDLPTAGEQLTDRDIDWVYYAPEPHQTGYFWSAYNSIPNVFNTELWDQHVWGVDDLMTDVGAGVLPAVTWIVPRFELSDHPPMSTCFAHDWVTEIVNGIMRGPMWEHTAIFITWDEWGGFYDHVPPPIIGERELGFRVPMLVISPYARRGFIDDAEGEFTSPLKFIADNWDLPYLTDAIADTHNFEHVFDFSRGPRPPDPRPRRGGCLGRAFNFFPDDHPEWPDDVEPEPPGFIREEG